MTLDKIKVLLPLLKANGVSSFTQGPNLMVDIKFHVEQKLEPVISTQDHMINAPEEQLPVDLRTDNVNDHDKVMHWSSSPDPSELGEHPGTGDLQLTLASE